MYRGPSYGGRSKATPTTLCQKCLKRDIYECTAAAQERPYKSRPSRTQQLLNPKLKPRLMTEVPNDLVEKKGIADDILGKREENRARLPSRDADDPQPSRKRSRSMSTSSDDSVSTISTNRSRSASAAPQDRHSNGKASLRGGRSHDLGKRRRRSASYDSSSSGGSYSRAGDRNTRRRMSSFSPAQRGRGRKRSRSRASPMDTSSEHDGHPNGKRSPSASRKRSRSRGRRRQSPRHRRRSPPPGKWQRGAEQTFVQARPAPSSLSPSRSVERVDKAPRSRSPMRIARSPSPYRPRRSRSRSPYNGQNGFGGNREEPQGRRGTRFDQGGAPSARNNGPAGPPHQQRERSLSPYSKRVAMTRAMNG